MFKTLGNKIAQFGNYIENRTPSTIVNDVVSKFTHTSLADVGNKAKEVASAVAHADINSAIIAPVGRAMDTVENYGSNAWATLVAKAEERAARNLVESVKKEASIKARAAVMLTKELAVEDADWVL